MQADSFTEFLQQGAIIRLIIVTIFFGILAVLAFGWVAQRAAERRRRKEEGRPPLPSIFTQIWHAIKNAMHPPLQDEKGDQQAAEEPSPDLDDLIDNLDAAVPLPSVDDLVGKFPEPELEALMSFKFGSSTRTAAQASETATELVVTEQDEPHPENDDTAIAEGEIMPANVPETAVGEEPQRSESGTYVPGSNQLPSDAVEVMRAWRDVSDGALIIQMGDQLFQTLAEMQDRGMAKRFISLVKDLGRLASAGSHAIELPSPDVEVNSPVAGTWSAPQHEPPQPKPASETSTPLEPTPPTGSIAEQIEELLQYRLTQSPRFRHRSIHVRSNLDGSLRIEVDGRSYDHVGDVDDVEVRDFLQDVIREWEARQ